MFMNRLASRLTKKRDRKKSTSMRTYLKPLRHEMQPEGLTRYCMKVKKAISPKVSMLLNLLLKFSLM